MTNNLEFQKSSRKNKKYQVYYNGKWIHFGDTRYEHYKDKTPLKLYSYLDHKDKKRRQDYLNRSMNIKDNQGNLTYNNKNSSNYYAIKYLW